MSSLKHVYILPESDRDEIFFKRLCERVTGFEVEVLEEFRNRLNAGHAAVLAVARLLLARCRKFGDYQNLGIIIAVDNDRAPGCPGNSPGKGRLSSVDQNKAQRYPDLLKLIHDSLGSENSARPVDVALAVPKEMLESWLLILLEPDREELPLFSRADSGSARQYYRPQSPPSQLKDIRDEIAKNLGLSLDDLFFTAADQGDLDALAARSPSFALFREDLRQWRSAAPEC